MTVLFEQQVVVLFFPLFPILMLITAIKLTCIFWLGAISTCALLSDLRALLRFAEKYNVLRRYPRPKILDHRLPKMFKSTLPSAIILNLFFLFYIFRNDDCVM